MNRLFITALLLLVSCLQSNTALAADEAYSCEFRPVTINNVGVSVQYFVGGSSFSDGEIERLISTMKKYKIKYNVKDNKILIMCSLYGDFDYMHNITKKAGFVMRLDM